MSEELTQEQIEEKVVKQVLEKALIEQIQHVLRITSPPSDNEGSQIPIQNIQFNSQKRPKRQSTINRPKRSEEKKHFNEFLDKIEDGRYYTTNQLVDRYKEHFPDANIRPQGLGQMIEIKGNFYIYKGMKVGGKKFTAYKKRKKLINKN